MCTYRQTNHTTAFNILTNQPTNQQPTNQPTGARGDTVEAQSYKPKCASSIPDTVIEICH